MNVTFDCTDSARMARFWGEVTRWPATKVDMPGNPFWVVASEDDALPHLVFVEVHESKQVKNRIHLDLLPQDGSQADELDRLQALGARIIYDRREASPGGWIVMADIEGNEFCLEQGG